MLPETLGTKATGSHSTGFCLSGKIGLAIGAFYN